MEEADERVAEDSDEILRLRHVSLLDYALELHWMNVLKLYVLKFNNDERESKKGVRVLKGEMHVLKDGLRVPGSGPKFRSNGLTVPSSKNSASPQQSSKTPTSPEKNSETSASPKHRPESPEQRPESAVQRPRPRTFCRIYWLPIEKLLVFCRPDANVCLPSSSRSVLRVPRTQTKTYGDTPFSVAAPRIWKSIPVHTRSSSSITTSKSQLKTIYSQWYLYKLLQSIVYLKCGAVPLYHVVGKCVFLSGIYYYHYYYFMYSG